MFTIVALLNFSAPACGQQLSDSKDQVAIKNVLIDYLKYSRTDDTDNNIEIMNSSLIALSETDSEIDQDLIINVWLYYKTTKFSPRELTEKILLKNKTLALRTLDKMTKSKNGKYNKGTTLYSELMILKIRLS